MNAFVNGWPKGST